MRATVYQAFKQGAITGMVGALLGVAVALWGAVLWNMWEALGAP